MMKQLVLAIFAMGVAVTATAQTTEYSVKKGDTVRVQPSATHYLTGEKISPWVYDSIFTVIQLTSKSHPDGILLSSIMSWVSFDAVGCYEIKPEPEPQPKPQPEPEPVIPEPAPVVEPVAPVFIPEPEPEPQPQPQPEPVDTVVPDHVVHLFGIGVRGGVASLFQKVEGGVAIGKSNIGGGAALDLEYTFLSKTVKSGLCRLGFKTGVSLAYAGNSFTCPTVANQYEFIDDLDQPLQYTVAAKSFKETDNQLMMQIPLMFALRGTKGFYFAVGPKFSIPVYGWFKNSYENPQIDCYFTELDVHQTNTLITGRLDGAAPVQSKKLNTAKFNLLLGGEVGYEFALKNGDGLGLMVYGDYSVYDSYTKPEPNTLGFIQVGSPKAGGPDIYTNSLMNAIGSNLSYFSAGIKLSYNFHFNGK